MRTTVRRLATATLIAGSVAASPTHAQREVPMGSDSYAHLGAGVIFPEEVDAFRRGRVIEYDAQGNNVSVGYKPSDQRGEMTVFVYPGSEQTCRFWFEDADRAVMTREGAARSSEATPMRLLPVNVPDQHSARYKLAPGSYGFDHPELVSYLWVGCVAGGKWVVKYRGSFEAANEDKAKGLAEQLFAAIDWTALTDR